MTNQYEELSGQNFDLRHIAKHIGCSTPTYQAVQKHFDRLTKELEDYKKASGLCLNHKPSGGTRNCLVCGCLKLIEALSLIDQLVFEPNEMGVSPYDLDYDEQMVVSRVAAYIEEIKGQKND